MRKWVLAALALTVLAAPGAADEYGAWVIKADGEQMDALFVNQTGTTITLKVNGQTTTYNTGEIGLVVFDNNYTNFETDDSNKSRANPHLVCQKNGDVLAGNVTSFIPGGKMVMIISNRAYTYDAVSVARIYYNIHAFFASVEITGVNKISSGEEEADDDDKDKDKDKGKGKDKDKKNGKKDKKKEEYQDMVGGQVFIRMKGGATTTGMIYDVMGTTPTLVLTDGRRIDIPNIDMLNFQSTQTNYPGDKNKIQIGGATFILRNGAVAGGVIVDFRGTPPVWELTDGRQIPADQVARIYFR